MNQVECPGLPADWLNAWLAAIGLLVLEPRLRLSWTREASPNAMLTADNGAEDPLVLAASAWPSPERLQAMPIAQHREGLLDMRRTVPLEVFQQRADLARSHPDSWTLSSTVTDLCVDVAAESTVRHAPLDPKGPGTIKWLHHRLLKSHSRVEQPEEAVIATLKGYGKRVVDNGLGFDSSRITALADGANKVIDPVVEVLAFFGLRILPMRGAGVEVGKSGTRRPACDTATGLEPRQERDFTRAAHDLARLDTRTRPVGCGCSARRVDRPDPARDPRTASLPCGTGTARNPRRVGNPPLPEARKRRHDGRVHINGDGA